MHTDGETLVSDQASWIWIGFKFGIGFGLAGTIFAFIGGLGAALYSNLEMQRATASFNKNLRDAANSIPRYTPEPMESVPRARPPQTITVPAKSGRECLAESNNVINEQYQRCVKGYTYQQPAQ